EFVIGQTGVLGSGQNCICEVRGTIVGGTIGGHVCTCRGESGHVETSMAQTLQERRLQFHSLRRRAEGIKVLAEPVETKLTPAVAARISSLGPSKSGRIATEDRGRQPGGLEKTSDIGGLGSAFRARASSGWLPER